MTENKPKKPKLKLPGGAIDEAAGKIIKSVIGKSAEGTVDFLADIFGALGADSVREFRTRNLIKEVSRTVEIFKQHGGDITKIDSLDRGDLYRLFEKASNTDDKLLQEMWAQLLVNSALKDDPKIKLRTYVNLVDQLDHEEASILNFLYEYELEVRSCDDAIEREISDFEAEIEQKEILFEKSLEVKMSTHEQERLQAMRTNDDLKTRETNLAATMARQKQELEFLRNSFDRDMTEERKNKREKCIVHYEKKRDAQLPSIAEKWQSSIENWSDDSIINLLRLLCIIQNPAHNHYDAVFPKVKTLFPRHTEESKRVSSARLDIEDLYSTYRKTIRTNYHLSSFAFEMLKLCAVQQHENKL